MIHSHPASWWTNSFQNINCYEGLLKLPDECIDCVITSPPYWTPKNSNQDQGIGFEKMIGDYVGNLLKIFKEVKRVLKKQGTLFVNIGDCMDSDMKCYQIPEGFSVSMRGAGWLLRREFLRVHKNEAEKIYMFSKSLDYYFHGILPTVWHIEEEQRFIKWPEELPTIMIKAGCPPEGGIVLDPFAGHGTTLKVAKKLGRNYLGFETDKDLVNHFLC